MNKLLTKIVGAALGLTMTVGVGVAVASQQNSGVQKVNAAASTYTKVASLSAGKEVLIVSHSTSGQYYLMDAVTAATSAGPKYITCSLSNSQITGEYDSHLFTVAASSTNWKFSTGSKYLKWSGTSSNSAIRINTGDSNNTWTYSSGTMKFSSATRYLGVYTDGTDWRSYNSSTAANYSGTGGNIEFYEKSSAAQTYTVSFNANGGTGSMSNVTDVSGSYTLPACTFTAPSGKTFSGWKANNAGDLIAVGGSYTVSANVTFYAQWVNAYTVTYTAGTNGSGSYAHTSQPTGTYTLLPFASLTGVSATTGYRFKDYTVSGATKNPGDTITLSAAVTVTVNFEVKPLEAIYDFVTNFDTYSAASGSYEGTDWGGYGSRTITAAMVDADFDATISFTNVSKQGGTITDRPVIAAKYNVTSTMLFTLASSVSSSYTITTVDVKFAQWGTKVLNAALYKGTNVSGTALDSFTSSSNPRDLVVSNLNGDSFIVDFVSKDSSGTTNYQLGITSITIGLAVKASFGTTDHIKVTSFPNTIYHIGEAYDSTGLAVTAYDGADEATANFKDVTNDVTTGFRDGYVFQDTDVPTAEMFVEYRDEGTGTTFAADPIVFHVYALAEYKLVTEEPNDWSGNYLIVGTNADDELDAFNGSLSSLDAESNYKIVSADGNNVIETGQELEWTITAVSGGYSIQSHSGKYIGWSSNSGNGLTASDAPLTNTISISGSDVTIAGSGGRHLKLNTGANSRFRYYESGTVQLYKLVESDDVSDYADLFLETLSTGASAVCHYDEGTGEVTTVLSELKAAWKDLADAYDLLSPADKEQFRLGSPSTDPNATNLGKALHLYDHIATTYGTQLESEGLDNYNFMNRSITPLHGQVVTVSNSGTAAIVAIVSVISLSAVAGYFMLRKRKEQ